MSRISKVPREKMDPELQQLVSARTSDFELGVIRIWAHAPDLAKAFIKFRGAQRKGRLPRRLVEIVRLRIAYHSQCPQCMAVRFTSGIAAGVTEEIVCSLDKPDEVPDLTPAERSALRYADLMATDHFSIDDRVFDDLRQHFSEAEIVELGCVIATFIGFTRLDFSWNMVEELPERYRTTKPGELTFGPDSHIASDLSADGSDPVRPVAAAHAD